MRDYFSDDIPIRVVSAGDRNEGSDLEDITTISGQMLRDFVRRGGF